MGSVANTRQLAVSDEASVDTVNVEVVDGPDHGKKFRGEVVYVLSVVLL